MECPDMHVLNAQAELWNLTFSFIKSMALKCAIEVGIPNAIHNHGQPMTLHELHAVLSLPMNNKPNLWRLLRLLTHLGFLVVQDTSKSKEAAYDLTPLSHLVIKKADSTSSLSFALAMLDFAIMKPSLDRKSVV